MGSLRKAGWPPDAMGVPQSSEGPHQTSKRGVGVSLPSSCLSWAFHLLPPWDTSTPVLGPGSLVLYHQPAWVSSWQMSQPPQPREPIPHNNPLSPQLCWFCFSVEP